MNNIQILSQLLAKFPGVGKKTALRHVYFLLKEDKQFSKRLASMLDGLHESIRPCKECGDYSEETLCKICSDLKRSRDQLCIIAHVQDIMAIEDCQGYNGLYHVLGGLISPLEGQGPEQLSFEKLQQRMNNNSFKEVILATPPTIEGEVTAQFIMNLFKGDTYNFTRIAQGMPKGGDFEFTDRFTLSYALEARRTL